MEYETKGAPAARNVLDPLAEELSSYAPQGEGDELEDLLADEVAADIALEDLTPLRGGTHHGSPGMFEGSPHPSIAAAAAPAPQKHETHCFLVVYWPGHEQHTFTNDHFALGDQLDEDTLWGQFRDAPSSDAAFKLLMKYAPREFFVNGATLMKNSSVELRRRSENTTPAIEPCGPTISFCAISISIATLMVRKSAATRARLVWLCVKSSRSFCRSPG